jgi:hypothetical protein
MAWRIHLANQAIRTLHILPAKHAVLAAWTRPNHVEYFDLDTGAILGENTLPLPPHVEPSTTQWQEYVQGLVGFGNSYLPALHFSDRSLFLTDDGKTRLYWDRGAELVLDQGGIQNLLPVDNIPHFLAIEFDRQLGTVAAITVTGEVALYQQDILLGTWDVGLSPSAERRVGLAIARSGQAVFATDGRTLVSLNQNGYVKKHLEAHYDIGMIACSPNGQVLATTDNESGVIRLYRGDDLQLTHQKFAIDLVAHAQQLQLLAEMPPVMTAVTSMALYNAGIVTFAMAGVICVTHSDHMDALPRTKAMF